MALSKADNKVCRLVKAVTKNPNSNQAWAALMNESDTIAQSLRDVLVATGRMTLVP